MCYSFMIGLYLFEQATPRDPHYEEIPFPILFVYGTLFIFAFAVSAAFGTLLGAMLCPVVVARRLYWLGFVAAGGAIAGATILLLALTYLVDLDPQSFLLSCAAGFVLAVGMRVIGLTLGWARPWFAPGMCQACGYDLRETPAGNSCPECGEVAEKPFLSRS